MTYTYTTLEVTAATYDEIVGKLLAAGYDHPFDNKTGTIDMHDVGLVKERPSTTTEGLFDAMDGGGAALSGSVHGPA